MEFGKYGTKRDIKQEFDIHNTFIEQAGEKINIYDKIQAATEDTDIYQTLEKYGSIKTLELNKEAVFAEFNKTMSLRDIQEQQIAADNMWQKLPLKVREQFNNNKLEFLQNGQKWLEEQFETERANKEAQIAKEKEISAQMLEQTKQKEN